MQRLAPAMQSFARHLKGGHPIDSELPATPRAAGRVPASEQNAETETHCRRDAAIPKRWSAKHVLQA